MRDYLPAEMRLRQHIVKTLSDVAERYGFEPMQTPIVEYESTLAGKVGDEEKLIYRLQYGDDKLALRYDQTVSLARVVGQYPNDITFPFRRYAFGPSYRGERPQRGRFREFYQFDLDIVGADSRVADAEIIAVIYEALGKLGFAQRAPGFRVLVNHRDVLQALARVAGVPDEQGASVYRSVDKLDKIGADGVRAELLRANIDEQAVEQILAFISLSGSNTELLAAMADTLTHDRRGAQAVADIRSVVQNAANLGVPDNVVTVAPRIARALSYYTGIIFEAVIEQPPIGSLLGGGRYDELIGAFAGRKVPTVGTAFGIERLQIVMTELGLLPVDQTGAQVYVAMFADELADETLKLAQELRAAGMAVISSLAADKLGKQFKEADQKGVRYVVVLGPDELAANEVQVKNLQSGEQQRVSRAHLVEVLRG
jgi:histidyl-tRNA synthetase